MEQPSPDSYSTPVTEANTKNATLDKWLLVLMIFFIIAALVVGILYALIAPQNTVFLNDEPKLYTFSQIYGKQLKNEGKDSIQCGDGKKVTIVNAQFYVYDSYRQCYPTGELAFTPDTADFADTESNANPNRYCGPYWSGGVGTEGTGAPTASGSTGEATDGSESLASDCVFAGGTGTGRSCWGGNYQCTWKNITQYIAIQCDGKSTCPLTVNESIGPSPCNILMDLGGVVTQTEFDNFPKSVPVTNGENGSTPGGESGLYVTGTYLCAV